MNAGVNLKIFKLFAQFYRKCLHFDKCTGSTILQCGTLPGAALDTRRTNQELTTTTSSLLHAAHCWAKFSTKSNYPLESPRLSKLSTTQLIQLGQFHLDNQIFNWKIILANNRDISNQIKSHAFYDEFSNQRRKGLNNPD